MGVDRGDEVIDRGRTLSITELIEKTTAAPAPPERQERTEPAAETLPPLDKLTPLPKPGDPYKAYARPDNQMLPTLHLLKSDGQKWGFPYSCRVEGPHMLFSDDPGKGAVIVLASSRPASRSRGDHRRDQALR